MLGNKGCEKFEIMICLVRHSENSICNMVLVWIIEYPLGVLLSNPIFIRVKTY